MKKALVLTGGGSMGSFQAGFLSALAMRNYSFDVIACASIGSLNGAMYATGQGEDLTKHWLETGGKLSLLFGRGTAKRFIETHMQLSDIPAHLLYMFEVATLDDGRVHTLTNAHFSAMEHGNGQFQKALLAAVTLPGVWPAVDFIKTEAGPLFNLIDGGLFNVSPLDGFARLTKEQQADYELTIVTCRPAQPEPYKKRNRIADLFRTANLVLGEVLEGDLAQINGFNGRVKLVQPDYAYPSSSFKAKQIEEMIIHGHSKAAAYMYGV